MPFPNTLSQVRSLILMREGTNNTTDIGFEGPRGNGKSNNVLLLFGMVEPGWSFRESYAYDGYDLARILKLTMGKKRRRVWFDEAKNFVYKRNAMTRSNKAISEMMSQIREDNGTRFWATPDIDELEGFLVKDQLHLLFTSPERGKLIVWRFWKNYHAPPGKREGRWTKCFVRNVPDVRKVLPEREAAYRQWKMAGYVRKTTGLVDKLLNPGATRTMSIGRRGENGVLQTVRKNRFEEPIQPGS